MLLHTNYKNVMTLKSQHRYKELPTLGESESKQYNILLRGVM